MKNQKILSPDNNYLSLDKYFLEQNVKQLLLICGKFISSLKIGAYFKNLNKRMGITVVQFDDFLSNPTYEDVIKAVHTFQKKPYEMIVAVGGGSAIDLAKCVKLFSKIKDGNYLQQNFQPVNIPLLAIPTTAGTGSEATKYAVIYYQGVKQSITDNNCIPNAVLLDASLLNTLPIYQRKSTLMDAFCHALESFWSINSTRESKIYSQKALKLILKYGEGYLKNQDLDNSQILIASNLSGKAINITQTTAGHALCYKLTSMFGLSHGHAAAICVLEVWKYMSKNLNNCIDIRGQDYLKIFWLRLLK